MIKKLLQFSVTQERRFEQEDKRMSLGDFKPALAN
jgi:hypothetical protein